MENVIKLLHDFSSKMELTVEAQRAGMEQLGSMAKLPKDVKYEAVDAGGVPAEWITTPETNNGFQMFTAFTPESRESLKKIGDFTNKFLK